MKDSLIFIAIFFAIILWPYLLRGVMCILEAVTHGLKKLELLMR